MIITSVSKQTAIDKTETEVTELTTIELSPTVNETNEASAVEVNKD
jgi:hypothetical protein